MSEIEVSQLKLGTRRKESMPCRYCGKTFLYRRNNYVHRYCLECRNRIKNKFGFEEPWEQLTLAQRSRVVKHLWYLRHREREIERAKKHYYEHKRKHLETSNERIKKRRLEIIKAKGGKCEICNFDNDVALVIHHIDGVDDSENRWDYLKDGYNLSQLQLLCRNCHAIIHHEPTN